MPNYNPQGDRARVGSGFGKSTSTFATPDTSAKPKYYILDMFPYPSGAAQCSSAIRRGTRPPIYSPATGG